ncbi:DEAD/DEAH box helicase [Streptomyces sp. NPDC023998]|uniref:DEAD/DEAH box helicase n=1 Tax=Streptomyces sp. NPDC023998 TaxID=3154597 RepID=UPI0033CD5304
MPLNWDQVGEGDSESILRPRDIYAAISIPPWPYLRHEQGEVLDKWFERRNQRDVVIKQNTGGGKTAVGLLIAQSTLNEGIGKAVYLTSDKYLTRRVREEAEQLRLTTTDDPAAPEFRANEAILVTNYKKLINGLSQFGVVGGDREITNLGIVVVDDAHAALAITEGQFRLRVPADHEAYDKLLEIFASDLRKYVGDAYAEIKAKDYTALARIPFWAWSDRKDRVLEALVPHRRDDGFLFAWPLLSNVLHLCSATVTSRAVEIHPPCPPIDRIPAFARAQRRVYLTATLADDSLLVTDFDADPALVADPVTPGSAADLGERMILAPVALNPRLGDGAVRKLAREFANGDRDGDGIIDAEPVNVVVLVPSDDAAKAWRHYADRIHHVGDLDAGVKELRDGHVGLVVLVNKYDGVDLPHDACRLLVLDGIPRPMDAADRRSAMVLADSPSRRIRDVQRIEQGMGRGVRDNEDYCAVLLLGANLAAATYDPNYLKLFSPATQAQLRLSRDIAKQITGEGLQAVREALRACLGRQTRWRERSRRALAEVRYANTGLVRPEALAQREAFNLAVTGRAPEAADRIQQSINDVEDDALRGWLREQKAAYVHLTDAPTAQLILRDAVAQNPYVQRPMDGITPSRIKAAAVQARAAAQYLSDTYPDSINLVLGLKGLMEEIVYGDPDRTDEAERAWQKLGLHLGFMSTCPEKRWGKGPDNLWALTASKHAVIELKTGCTTATIAKSDLDQLGGSVRTQTEQDRDVRALPVMLHQSRICDGAVAPPPGMRVVTREKFDLLKEAVVQYAVALADGPGRWGAEQAVATQLAQGKLTAGQFFEVYAESPLTQQQKKR